MTGVSCLVVQKGETKRARGREATRERKQQDAQLKQEVMERILAERSSFQCETSSDQEQGKHAYLGQLFLFQTIHNSHQSIIKLILQLLQVSHYTLKNYRGCVRGYKARVLCCGLTHSALQRAPSATTSLNSQTFFLCVICKLRPKKCGRDST